MPEKVIVKIRTFDPWGRGIGALEDGTVVVVEDAEVGETVEAEVQYKIHTPVGKILYAKRVTK